MGLGRMLEIEFRGPKPEKWIFEENCLSEIIRVFENLKMFEFDGIGPVFLISEPATGLIWYLSCACKIW